MDPTTIIVLSLITSAFLLFAAVLAYGDYATQQVRRDKERTSPQEPKTTQSAPFRKAA